MQLTIHTDGGSRGNPGIAGGGVVALLGGRAVYTASVPLGVKTNNEAEYLAILHALNWLAEFVKENSVESARCVLDSKLVVEQLSHRWKIKEPRLRPLADQCWKIIVALPCRVIFAHVLRDQNARADELANQAMDAAELSAR